MMGAKPSDLPIEKIDRYELIVNLNAARNIGVPYIDQGAIFDIMAIIVIRQNLQATVSATA